MILIFLDASGFSMSPIRGATWAPIGQPTVLHEVYTRHSQSGLGFITITPQQHRVNFRFTIVDGAINTQDMIFFLTMIHRHYGKKVLMVMDRLPAHLSASKYFEREHSDWFEFVYLPSYAPELNPVELCWNHMKHVLMPNFVPLSLKELTLKTLESAAIINDDPELMKTFCKHAHIVM